MTLQIVAKQTLFGFVILGLLLVAPSGFAHADDDVDTDSRGPHPELFGEVKKDRPTPTLIRERIKERKESLKEKRVDVKTRTLQKREEVRSEVRDAQGRTEEHRSEVRERSESSHSDVRQRIRDESHDRRDRRDQALGDRVVDRAEAHLNRFIRLLDASIERIEGFIARIETHTDNLDARGIDTTGARLHLDEALFELSSAEANLIELDGIISSVFGSGEDLTREDLREALKDAKEVIKDARDNIKDAHKSVREAVRILTDSRDEDRDEDNNDDDDHDEDSETDSN